MAALVKSGLEAARGERKCNSGYSSFPTSSRNRKPGPSIFKRRPPPWIGSPDEIVGQIRRTQDAFGSYEHASLQVNFNMIPVNSSKRRANKDERIGL
jgi:hypothetical protein